MPVSSPIKWMVAGLTGALLTLTASAGAADDDPDFEQRNRCYPLGRTSFGDWNVPSPAAQRGPLPVSITSTDGGLTRQACARSEIGAVLNGRASDNGVLDVFGRWEVAPYQALALGTEVRRVPGFGSAMGNTTLALTEQLQLDAYKTIVAVHTRAVVPTSTFAGRVGGEGGVAWAHIQNGFGWLEYHAYAGGQAAVPAVRVEAGAPEVEAHALGVVGVQIHTYREPFALVLDLHGRAGTSTALTPAAGPRANLELFQLELGGGYSFASSASERGPLLIARISWLPLGKGDHRLH